jgi:hypothetical protein
VEQYAVQRELRYAGMLLRQRLGGYSGHAALRQRHKQPITVEERGQGWPSRRLSLKKTLVAEHFFGAQTQKHHEQAAVHALDARDAVAVHQSRVSCYPNPFLE